MSSFTDLSKIVSKNAGKSVTFTVKENGKSKNIVIKPNKEGKIGVEAHVDKSPANAIPLAFLKLEFGCPHLGRAQIHGDRRLFTQ